MLNMILTLRKQNSRGVYLILQILRTFSVLLWNTITNILPWSVFIPRRF